MTTTISGRAPGRPSRDDDPVERERHIRVAGIVLGGVYSTEAIARAEQVSPRTVQYWIRRALAYLDDPRCDVLRRIDRRRA